MKNIKTDLIPSLEESLFQPSGNITDILADIIEIGFDSDLQDGIFKEIPVIRMIAGLTKVGFAIRDRIMMVKTAHFLQAFHNDTIDPVLLEKHRKELEQNPRKAEQELSRVIILLDRAIEEIQAKHLGAFYRNHINERINWEQFVELSEANDRLFLADLSLLEKIAVSPIKENEELSPQIKYQIERLRSLGMVIEGYNILDAGTFDNWESPRDYMAASSFGKLFVTMKE